jgi:hypothetical protein
MDKILSKFSKKNFLKHSKHGSKMIKVADEIYFQIVK